MSTRARRPATARPQQAGPADDAEDRLYRAVFDGVMSQRLTPGTRLPEASLCALFGVKRALVRKVLQRLAHEHMVELRPNRGAVVATPTPEETRQIFEARRALEAALLSLAVQHAGRADLAALRRQLAAEHAALHASGPSDQPAWARLASSFHLQVAALGRNPVLLRYLHELVSRCSLIVALYEPPGNATCEHDEHAQIVDAIARRDAPAAVALMDQHLRALEDRIELDRRLPDHSLAQMLGLA